MPMSEAWSLDQLGRQLDLDQSSARHGYLEIYDKLLPRPPAAGMKIVVFGFSPIARTQAQLLADYYTGATVTIAYLYQDDERTSLRPNVRELVCKDIDDLVLLLCGEDPVDVFIEHGNNKRSQKLHTFIKVFPVLTPYGYYCIEDVHATYMEKFSDIQEDVINILNRAMEIKSVRAERTGGVVNGLPVEALSSVSHYGRLLIAQRSEKKLFGRIHEKKSSRLFSHNTTLMTKNISVMPAETIKSRAEIRTNRLKMYGTFNSEIQVPEIRMRVYQDAICTPGQIVYKKNAILPESFRMSLHKVPKNRNLVQHSDFYARPSQKNWRTQGILNGSYLYIDNELDSHYGHITAETVSKLWAWEEAQKYFSDIKILAGASNGEISPVLLEILNLYGIPADRIVGLDAPMSVERLICPTQLYHIGAYASPRIETTWNRLIQAGQTRSEMTGRKLFLSRPPGTERGCRNVEEVEKIFAEAGYDTVFPEEYSLREQITMLSTARAIGGFAGSATLNAIYAQPGTRKTIIASETFNSGNDYLISTLKGGQLNYFFCNSEIQHPPGGWSVEAFMANYSFDLQNDGELLRAVI